MGNNVGAFPMIKRLTQLEVGGKIGNQYISWISETDYARAIEHLIEQDARIYNLCVPNPIKNRDYQKLLRKKVKVPFEIPLKKWMLKIRGVIIGTEPEMLLKSRYAYPEKLLQSGFQFETKRFEDFNLQSQ